MKSAPSRLAGIILLTLGLLAGAEASDGNLSPDARALVEADWQLQEKISWKRLAGSPESFEALLERGNRLAADLEKLGVPVVAEQAMLAKAASQEASLARYLEVRWMLRELVFSNPLLDFDELLFVKRITPTFNHQCAHRVGEAQIPPANLCILTGLHPDGSVRELLSGEHAQGGIGRPDLSFDGKRIVFPHAKLRVTPTNYRAMPRSPEGCGTTLTYDIYEIGTDGSGLRQLTNAQTAEDTEPCYLSDGRIAFTSSRADRFVQCGDWALVFGIYSMAADGTDIRKITEPQDGEFYPSMLEDGRIMYTRWDYVMKPYNTQQQLWAVNPDGRRAELVYGDYYTFSTGPIALFEARQIPGTSKVVCTGAAHHNNCAGPIMVVDLNQSRGGPEGMLKVTPEIHYPEIQGEGGGPNAHSETGWFSAPYPLDENHFLVCHAFEKAAAHAKYGLYLMDIHGNRELIYRTGDRFACYSPIPVRPRETPPMIPDMVQGVPEDTPATLIVNDVYQGLLQEGVKRGEVKHLRIVEVLPKTEHTSPRRMDLGVNCGWDTRAVLGTVPVEEDGSAHFNLPPHKLILLEALDGDYLEIKRMRNYLNMKPGEINSCIGCHEPYGAAPAGMARGPKAARRAPSAIVPPPWGVQGMSFRRVVQPVLDQHCISCHDDSEGKDKAFDLTSNAMVVAPGEYDLDEGPQHAVSASFLNLLGYVDYVKVGGYKGLTIPSKANSTGSRTSPLMQILKEGHGEVALPLAEWRALAAWIDCNAPFYGDFEEIVSEQNLALILTRADRHRITERAKEIDRRDASSTLAAYLDCGACVKTDPGKEGVSIHQIQGRRYLFPNAETVEGVCRSEADIAFDSGQVIFKVDGLASGRRYKVGIRWWDYDAGHRVASVHCSASAESPGLRLVAPTALPSHSDRKQLPATIVAEIPSGQIVAGTTHIAVQQEAGPNVVVGEIWIMEDSD